METEVGAEESLGSGSVAVQAAVAVAAAASAADPSAVALQP